MYRQATVLRLITTMFANNLPRILMTFFGLLTLGFSSVLSGARQAQLSASVNTGVFTVTLNAGSYSLVTVNG